jgi:hypothetical protein
MRHHSRHLNRSTLREAPSPYATGSQRAAGDDIDASLIATSLAMTPWERMLANDDALNFGDSLRAAMIKRHAKPL